MSPWLLLIFFLLWWWSQSHLPLNIPGKPCWWATSPNPTPIFIFILLFPFTVEEMETQVIKSHRVRIQPQICLAQSSRLLSFVRKWSARNPMFEGRVTQRVRGSWDRPRHTENWLCSFRILTQHDQLLPQPSPGNLLWEGSTPGEACGGSKLSLSLHIGRKASRRVRP